MRYPALCPPALLAVLLASTAAAQSYGARSDIAASPSLPGSIGVKVGDGRLHPYLQLDSHHLYNPLRSPTQRQSDIAMVLRPGFQLAMPSPKLDLTFDGNLEYQRFVEFSSLSHFALQASANVVVNKEGATTVRFFDTVTRIQDFLPDHAEGFVRHWTNTVGLGVDLKPGGGALMLTFGYSFYFDLYDRDVFDDGLTPASVSREIASRDNIRHIPTARAAWKFLPKTSLFIEAQTQLARYPNDTDARAAAGSAVNADSNILDVYLGLTGAITPKMTALLKGGYANTFAARDNAQSPVAQGELTWQLSELTKLRGGGILGIEPVARFQYTKLYRGYLRIDKAFTSRLMASAGAEYSYYDFGPELARAPVQDPLTPLPANDDRNDTAVNGNLTIAYYATEWLTVSLIERLTVRNSNYVMHRLGETTGELDYVVNDITLRLGVKY